jgi:hypothetical protein
MSKKERKIILYFAILCVLTMAIMIIALNVPKSAQMGDFIPPEFDAFAQKGEPDIPENLGFIEPYADGMEFRAGFCGNLIIEQNTAKIYFTNKDGNNVWIMLRILDENGNILAQTGLLRPGEYIENISFKITPQNGQKVICKVMAYEPETYFSKGYYTVKTKANIK